MTARYNRVFKPGHPNADAHGQVQEHVFVMSEIVGRALTDEEVVHHCDENKKNNAPANLRLFPSHAAHLLHHAELRALKACGNSSFMKCRYCKVYDDPVNMVLRKDAYGATHKECSAINSAKAYAKRKLSQQSRN